MKQLVVISQLTDTLALKYSYFSENLLSGNLYILCCATFVQIALCVKHNAHYLLYTSENRLKNSC